MEVTGLVFKGDLQRAELTRRACHDISRACTKPPRAAGKWLDEPFSPITDMQHAAQAAGELPLGFTAEPQAAPPAGIEAMASRVWISARRVWRALARLVVELEPSDVDRAPVDDAGLAAFFLLAATALTWIAYFINRLGNDEATEEGEMSDVTGSTHSEAADDPSDGSTDLDEEDDEVPHSADDGDASRDDGRVASSSGVIGSADIADDA